MSYFAEGPGQSRAGPLLFSAGGVTTENHGVGGAIPSLGTTQRRQLFGQDLAVDAAGRGAEEPTAGQEDQGEARLTSPLGSALWCSRRS